MSVHWEKQIERLKAMILTLGGLVEESLEKAIRAVQKRDPDLARAVIEGDERIDRMEIEIEEECLHTLALYQPVASELRFVVAVLKINNDLERMADLAVNISEQAIFLCQHPPVEQVPFDLATMSRQVRWMAKSALDALVQQDTQLAEEVRRTDDQVDQIHRAMYRQLPPRIVQNPQEAPALLHYLSISRQLERIADHATNIAEDVLYLVRGDILRHARPHPLKNESPPASADGTGIAKPAEN